MKQRIKRRRNSAIAIGSLVIILLIAISTVFSPQIFTASAYAQSDLARAEKAESRARQEYETAKTEADRLESIKQGFDTAEQDEILANAALKIREKMESKLMAITDSAINDIAVIYENKGYTYTQKLNETENILDKASSSISSLINDLKTDARTCYDEYIDVFLDDDVDYSYAWDTLYAQVAKSPGYVDFLLWDLFLDMENGNSIETNRDVIHNAIAEEADNIENTITYEVPGWVAYCIDREIENGMGDLEEKWQSALQTLVEIRQELCEYDYSVLPEAVDYTQNTENSVVFTINGDFDAVKKIEHFDMQEEPVWNEEYEEEVIFGTRILPGEEYVVEKGENNTIIVRFDNDFLNKQSQGDHIFRLYYMTEDGDEYVPFMVSALPMGWTTEKSYDDGQDWEAEPVLVESESAEDEYVSDADTEAEEKSFMSSITPLVWMIVLAVIFVLIAVIMLIFLIIYRKKKKKLLKDEKKSVIIKEEKSAKTKIKTKTKAKHKAGKTLLMLLFVFSTLTFSFSGLTANAATSVSNIRYTFGDPVTTTYYNIIGDAVTVSGWGRTYDFNVLGWNSDDCEDPWGETTITGSGVSVAKGAAGQATFTTTNNRTNGTRNAGTVTINSPGGSYSFTVRQTVITYNISYNAHGGIGAPASQTKRNLINLKLSSVKPTREGYTFIGWTPSSAAKEAIYNPGQTYKVDANLTLYAVWKPKNVTVTWNANGGSTVLAWPWKKVGTKIGVLPSTKRANCDFEGWYAGADGTGNKISSTTTVPVRSTTYYAKWELRPGQVSLQTKFSVTPASLTFTYDTTKQSTVTVRGYEGNSSTINYWNKLSVSKPDWIKVSKDSKGKLSISVKENKKTQSRSGIIVLTSYNGGLCKINVTQAAMPVPVSSVSLDRSAASIDIGKTVTLKATVAPEDAANKRVTWTSSNTNIATVSSSGVVKGLKKGTVTITVKTSDGGKTAKCKVTVNPPSITVVPTYVTLHVGEKTKLSVKFTPSNGTDDSVTWSRPFAFFTAAEVDSDGTVTAIRPGKTVVTAKSKDGRKSTCTVEVVKKIEVTSISVTPKSYTINEGYTIKLSANILPLDATDKSLTWSSSDRKIATVDSNGTVKGVKGGTLADPKKVTITATAQDGSGKKATCEIAVVAQDLTRFNNIPVYLTETQVKSYAGEDYISNDKNPDYFVEHTIYNCNKKENEEGEYYYAGDIAKTDSSLFNDMKWLRGAASGKLASVFDEMAERFHNETGGVYENDNLTNAVKSNDNTVKYCSCVEKHLKEAIEESKGDLTKLDYYFYSKRDDVPLVSKMLEAKRKKEEGWHFPTYSDMTVGLGITIHSWVSNNIYVDNFVMNANGDYSCTVRYEFYDVFGLDSTDVEGGDGQNAYGEKILIGQKFRAWYILQHLKDYSDANGNKTFKGKPFITKVEFTRSLSGRI